MNERFDWLGAGVTPAMFGAAVSVAVPIVGYGGLCLFCWIGG